MVVLVNGYADTIAARVLFPFVGLQFITKIDTMCIDDNLLLFQPVNAERHRVLALLRAVSDYA